MKFLDRVSLWAAPLLFAVLLAGAWGSFRIVSRTLSEEVDEWLLVRQQQIAADFPAWRERWGGLAESEGHLVPLPAGARKFDPVWSDTLLLVPYLDEPALFRQLRFSARDSAGLWSVTLRRPDVEVEDLAESLTLGHLIPVGALALLVLLLGRVVQRVLWRPFRDLLQRISAFDFRSETPFEAPRTGTAEFDELGAQLKRMTDKQQRDYRTLRRFTEDASHEMQTPVGAILARLELAMQSPDDPAVLREALQDAYRSANQLSRLHKALALLARLDNREFPDRRAVDLARAVDDRIDELRDLADGRGLVLRRTGGGGAEVLAHPELLDLLLRNLLHNAIRHNLAEDGWIEVAVDGPRLTVSNSGAPFDGDPAALFKRFRKGDPASPTLGLGLSIVDEICQHEGVALSYRVDDGVHRFRLDFPPAS